MIKVAVVLTAAMAVTACANVQGQSSPFSNIVADSPEARQCVTMGYRLGTSEHAYCVEVVGRRLTPDEYN